MRLSAARAALVCSSHSASTPRSHPEIRVLLDGSPQSENIVRAPALPSSTRQRLLERDSELAALDAAIAAAAGGHGSLVVIEAATRPGKTQLAGRRLAIARERGLTALSAPNVTIAGEGQ